MVSKNLDFEGELNFRNDRSDINALSGRYKQSGRVHIPEFLDIKSANKIHQTLVEQSEWNLVWNDQGKHTDLSYQGVMQWTQRQRDLLTKKICEQAENEFQYCYATIPIYDIFQGNLMPGHFFNDIYKFLNSPRLIAFVQKVTGYKSILYADMQATRFSSGHFITNHDDNVQGKNRLAAYVLNLTPSWQDDWGGALVFPGDASVSEVFFPKFNALNIFAVPQKHFVSFVTPFASAYRYSITGWFRY